MKTQAVTNAAVDLGSVTPFGDGFNAVAVNFTAGALVLQVSDDNVTFTDLVTVPTIGMANADGLKRYVKAKTAGTIYLLG